MLFAIGATLVLLRRTYRKSCFPAVLWAVCAGYIFLLLYATLLSRPPSDARMYQLEPFASLKGAFEMAEGTGLRLQAPQALEGIFLNLCLCVPVGYLLPLAFLQRGKQMRFWQVICAGAAVSASTVHRGQRAFARIPREQLAVQQVPQRCTHGVCGNNLRAREHQLYHHLQRALRYSNNTHILRIASLIDPAAFFLFSYKMLPSRRS